MPADLPERHRYLHRVAPTPLVPIQLETDELVVWCKLEFLNPSGSTKDRIARYIFEKAWRQGRLKCGDLVVEASSGSTSIALALASAQLGLRFLAVMPEGVSNERILIIRAYGGNVRVTPKADGIRGAIAETERLGREPGVFLPRQFAKGDERKICGLPPTYVALQAVRPREGKLLHYDQYVAPDGSQSVSFASVSFYR